MSGRPPLEGASVDRSDDGFCSDALAAIRAERSERARRRRSPSPTQSGFLVGRLFDAAPNEPLLPETIGELVQQGPRGFEELAARFPGPLWRDPRVERVLLPRAAEMGPLPLALTCFGPVACRVVVALLQSSDPEDRLCAAALAPAFPVDEVLRALARLTLHGDPDASRMATRALPYLAPLPAYAVVLDDLRATWRNPQERTLRRVRALTTLAQLGDATLVPQLVELLDCDVREIEDAAHAALCTLTAHDSGSSRTLWRLWLWRHADRPREQWLLRGLRSRRRRLRRLAVAGLSRLLGRPLLVEGDCDRRQCLALAETLAASVVSGQPNRAHPKKGRSQGRR